MISKLFVQQKKVRSSQLILNFRGIMELVKLIYDGRHYNYQSGSNLKMCILGCFLSSDVGCYWPSFKKWALDNASSSACSNITSLRKENGKVFLSDLYSEELEPTELEMTLSQFIQLLDDWEAKACKLKPKEVLIKYEHGQFIIETKN